MWPQCLESSTVSIFNESNADLFWQNDDREGYIRYSIANTLTLHNVPPTRMLASRWFNLPKIVTESSGDLWIHREHDDIWWTVTTDAEAVSTLAEAPSGVRKAERIVLYSKPCQLWSNQDQRGRRLNWNALHAKARTFLFAEGTLQQLSTDNAAYARTLIEGNSLSDWHEQPEWKATESKAGRGAVTVADARQKAILNMVISAQDTARNSNGQTVQRVLKNKEFRFPDRQTAERYVSDLMGANGDLCALTGVPLRYDAEAPSDFRPSLDRKDSSGHYEPENLQVVCWFVNRWKNDGDDASFRSLIEVVRGQ